jgi:hypothetical protein
MKVNKVQRVSIAVCLLGLMSMMVSCGGTVLTDLLNPDFAAVSGVVDDANSQITPDLPQYLWLKVTNQTNYAGQIRIAIKRAQTVETFGTVVMANQTIGKVVEACDSETNPVLSLFIPNLGDTSVGSTVTTSAVPVGQVLVTVDGVPVIVPATQLPGILNVRTDFNCGDTVEFVIHNSFEDPDRFRVSALIYRSTATTTE